MSRDETAKGGVDRAQLEQLHRELVERDRQIGVAVSPTLAQRALRDLEIRAAAAEARAAAAEAEIRWLRHEVDTLTKELAQVRASVSWRAGMAMTAPLRILRRLAR